MTWQPGWPIRSDADLEAARAVLAGYAVPAAPITKRPRVQREKITPTRRPVPLPGHPGVMVELRQVDPECYTGEGFNDPRRVFRRVVVADGFTDAVRGPGYSWAMN